MCPVWLVVAALVVGGTRGAVSQCWEHPSCKDFTSESSMMDCIQLCRSDLTAETPVVPGNAHLQPPPPSDPSSFIFPSSPSSSTLPLTKRSYSMEHFRWGKPVGRKRRPVKVYTSNDVEEESAEVFPGEMRRRALANELLAAAVAEEEEKAQEMMQEEQQQLLGGVQEKKDGPYKMKHFRWSGPPASKRYGGFMKSWDERSQRPLLTLFKNVINKDGQQQK
ncbi:pro-opiomelanocortin-like [Betta splendens]|uniref:Pro-opiomelanocortin-like n=1 Tax=Betta splendens TaxID=158456 RepID=A0A6P7LUX6_BETSP|nr:pro-opiomelanocortin-like [Betta splendens]XP_055362883.1 pro-opiomelanocortin-like [Betta splendens]